MIIRRLNPKDAELYRAIRLEALQMTPEAFGSSYEEEKSYPLELYEGRFQEEYSATFGAFLEEQLCGVVTLVREQRNKLKHRANIYGVYVSSEKRGRGIAKKLMLEAIREAEDMGGVEQIHLSVVTSNEAAGKLYRSLGFEAYGVQKKALKINDSYYDEELMCYPIHGDGSIGR